MDQVTSLQDFKTSGCLGGSKNFSARLSVYKNRLNFLNFQHKTRYLQIEMKKKSSSLNYL